MSESVYQVITDRIVGLLEKGTIPWQQPWQSGKLAPQNLITKRPYRGINSFLLGSFHSSSSFWVTFKQAQVLGGNVRRGEKGCPVVFWKWLEVDDKNTNDTKRIPLLRYYSVFNVAQCDGITVPIHSKLIREHSPVETAETIVQGMPNRPEIKKGLDQAFYSPNGDFVGIPAAEQFKSNEEFYSVLFHELIHSTGHECRLNRKGVAGTDGNWSAFGSNPYAKEELVAEMGAAFLCGEAGIAERTLDSSASYIASWLQRLKDDSKLVVMAAAQAQKAADFILGEHQFGTSRSDQDLSN